MRLTPSQDRNSDDHDRGLQVVVAFVATRQSDFYFCPGAAYLRQAVHETSESWQPTRQAEVLLSASLSLCIFKIFFYSK